MSRVRVAALQMRSGKSVHANIENFEALVREAADAGAFYVQSPEMTGILVREREELINRISSQDECPLVKKASELAAELGIAVHVGSTAIIVGGRKVANRGFLFGRGGELVATYDKIHMFDVDLDNGESWRESATYRPGEVSVVADMGFARIGMAVCYDLRFPDLFRAQALGGAEVLTVPAAFTRQTGEAHWQVLTRARAIENGAFLIAAAQGGRHEDGRETYGHSIIVDPWGRVLAEADGDEPGVIMAEIDPALVSSTRKKVPNLKNARDFELREVQSREAVE
ncbi:carbon-nitrogen hydrolase family protein [Nitratireductor basaltis]|uniref:Nitrilase/cyanide hydratase and apolipoprotein N-acyltransferase n=1 Tax=Nitratireductor basaltis TaxID=472175 RepID=A0A084U7P0_9HYPH|nr:carbon-nitrogen hydrolase family protein [Nitratireductor basaltis]KFB08976.1 Nitrilase/cyanide hydratase and apolipoprotein N-acyltransferase [Nitratireductor basaltis]